MPQDSITQTYTTQWLRLQPWRKDFDVTPVTLTYYDAKLAQPVAFQASAFKYKLDATGTPGDPEVTQMFLRRPGLYENVASASKDGAYLSGTANSIRVMLYNNGVPDERAHATEEYLTSNNTISTQTKFRLDPSDFKFGAPFITIQITGNGTLQGWNPKARRRWLRRKRRGEW